MGSSHETVCCVFEEILIVSVSCSPSESTMVVLKLSNIFSAVRDTLELPSFLTPMLSGNMLAREVLTRSNIRLGERKVDMLEENYGIREVA
mmetsp:Transcript_21476/g.37859  ORF Transcript_21476/g.37859 Transcript_21476/m.37859 type:complete len:91 (+) Transcript_21476:364-636(+)